VLPGTRPAAILAVLPFANLSVEHEYDHFAAAFTRELTGALRRLPGVRVAGRTSAAAFAGRARELDVIAGALGAAAVLDGRARRSRRQIAVDAELVSTGTGARLWTGQFSRPVTDALAVQMEIAAGIARELQVPHPAVGVARTPNADAYDLYLRGRSTTGVSRESLERGLEYFERAAGLDPEFGSAHAALAGTAAWLGAYGHLPFPGLIPRVRAAAARALDLEPSSAEARLALGMLALLADWNADAAARELEHALDADPHDAEVHRWRAWRFVVQGRGADAVEAARRIVSLDPLSGAALATLALVHVWLRQAVAAVDAGQLAIAADPNSFLAHRALAAALVIAGDAHAARPELDQAVLLSRRHPWCLAELAVVCSQLGDRRAAEALHDELLRRSPQEYVQRGVLAQTSAALGQLEDAFKLLDQAARLREPLPLLRRSPYFDAIRDHPRFKAVR
jgi:serine/threonine-protein kinase